MDLTNNKNGKIIFFLSNVVISVLAYLVLIANELTNTHDGMWKGSHYIEYDWPLQIGRWFWKYVGLLRGSVSPEPFTSVFSIMLFILGACLIIALFDLWKKPVLASIVVQGIVINEAVCIALSYRYMSPTFAFSFLMSILAVYAVKKTKWVGIPVAVIAITLMFGTYQANLGSAVLLTVSLFIILCCLGNKFKDNILFLVKTLASIMCGCILYKIIWSLFLKHYGFEAANYQNAGDISIKSIILNLPTQTVECYKTYLKYYSGKIDLKNHFFQNSKLFVIVFIVLMVALLARVIVSLLKKNWLSIAASAVAFLILPPSVGAVLLLTSPGTGLSMQMTMSYAIHCPLLLAMIVSLEKDDKLKISLSDLKSIKVTSVIHVLAVICSIYFLYGSFLMVSVDQHVMNTGKETSISLMNRIAYDLESRNGPLTCSEAKYIFIGRPCNNIEFRKDQLWDMANNYAQYGNFALVGNCNVQSYAGFFRDAGLYMPYADANTWHAYEENETVQNMPVYPNEGYVQMIDGYYIVKLS